MSTISVRLPDSLHKRIKSLSQKEHVSMNQLITLAVAEKISVLETEDYLNERASRGTEKKFLAVLNKVPSAEAADYDKL